MEYGVKYTLGGREVVSPVSNEHLAKSIASSWGRNLYPDATPVCRVSHTHEWLVLKDSSTLGDDLEYKEG